MWILPSRSRPHNLLRLIDAWVLTGASTPVEVCIDFDDPFREQYETMEIPPWWMIEVGHRGPLSVIYNDAYERHRDAAWFGFIADDVVPLTDAWDSILIEAAGSDGMAVPAGGETTGGCPHFVLGGDLVRSVGWLSLPGLDRLYIDTCWEKIAESRGVLRRLDDVILKHHHFSNRLAFFDKTYKKSTETKKNDRQIYGVWLAKQRREEGQSN